jgi:RimJ/RimL family protein N-acetyltransferase
MQNIFCCQACFWGATPNPDSFLERKAAKEHTIIFSVAKQHSAICVANACVAKQPACFFRKYGYYIGKLIRGINMNRKTLETDRLLLRRFDHNDLYDFYEMAKVPEVGTNAGWKPHESLQESCYILDIFAQSREIYAVVYKENNKVIGSLGIHPDTMRPKVLNVKNIGYVLNKDYWGKGIMTEAVKEVMRYLFEEMGMELLSVAHFVDNSRSGRVIEKCGFKYEGTIRKKFVRFDGKVLDECVYSITRDEYFEVLGDK